MPVAAIDTGRMTMGDDDLTANEGVNENGTDAEAEGLEPPVPAAAVTDESGTAPAADAGGLTVSGTGVSKDVLAPDAVRGESAE
jgi:hypothetical protein